MRRWRPLTSDLQCSLEIALWANHIQVLNEEKSALSVTEEMVSNRTLFMGRLSIIQRLCICYSKVYV